MLCKELRRSRGKLSEVRRAVWVVPVIGPFMVMLPLPSLLVFVDLGLTGGDLVVEAEVEVGERREWEWEVVDGVGVDGGAFPFRREEESDVLDVFRTSKGDPFSRADVGDRVADGSRPRKPASSVRDRIRRIGGFVAARSLTGVSVLSRALACTGSWVWVGSGWTMRHHIMTTPSIPTLTSVLLMGLSGPSGGDSKRRTSLTPSACPNSPVRNKSRSMSYTRMDLSVLDTPTSILGLCAGISAATVRALIITASVDS